MTNARRKNTQTARVMAPLLRLEVNQEGAEQRADGCVTPDKTCSNSDGGAGGGTAALAAPLSASPSIHHIHHCSTTTGQHGNVDRQQENTSSGLEFKKRSTLILIYIFIVMISSSFKCGNVF